jgi:hypothetical protein
MEITKTKQRMEYNDDIKDLIKIFGFKDEKMGLKGSSSLSVMNYYADYDFFTVIKNNYSIKEIYEEFSKILRNILENDKTYFTEFKIQQNDGTKYKWLPDDKFKLDDFQDSFNNNTNYCKIDIIYFNNNKFIEATCNYIFYGKKQTEKENLQEINKNINELKKDKNYYKVLKKLYLEYAIKGDTNKLTILTNVFNSDLGQIYKNINNIDAINIIKKFYGSEPLTKKRIEVNLGDIKYYSNYEKQYNKMKKELNTRAKEIYEKL